MEFRVGNLTAAPGQRVQGWLEVAGGGRLPVTLVNGRREGKTVTVMAGTHGSEYVGVEAVIRLARALDPEDLCGRVALVHLVNQAGFFGKSQYINPEDGKNLGGVYPGQPDGSESERIAYTITEELIRQSDLHIDLHSGDLHEDLDSFGWFDLNEQTQELSKKAAALMGADFVSFSSIDASALGMAARLGVPAISPEIGGCGRWDERHVQMDVDGITAILRLMSVLPGRPPEPGPLDVRRVAAIKSTAQGCFYPLVDLGQQVKKGQVIGRVCDLFGNLLAECEAPVDGEIFCVTRSLAIRPKDLMFGLKYQ